ncbi:MAG: hypothetical protein FJZ01_11545 [Candidatus Sericytochromatia bacterium]|nr:hypothetical protein [Candidatus Tanganyikabacteria bacterium]
MPENVGSIARAMANLGFSNLVVAGAPGLKDDPAALRLAVHCEHLLASTREAPDFDAAVAGADLVLGTTAHDAYETWDILDPWQAIDLAGGVPGEIALVFGSERYGLSKALLRKCHQVVHLPTRVPGESLNLAQAVLLFCWEFAKADAARDRPRAAGLTDVNPGPYWIDVLERAGALKPHNKEKRLATLRRIASRVRLSEEEAALLRGIGSKLALLLKLR